MNAQQGTLAAMSSREIATSISELSGNNARDRKLMTDHTRRVSKALRQLTRTGRVSQAKDELGRVVWRMAVSAASSTPGEGEQRMAVA